MCTPPTPLGRTFTPFLSKQTSLTSSKYMNRTCDTCYVTCPVTSVMSYPTLWNLDRVEDCWSTSDDCPSTCGCRTTEGSLRLGLKIQLLGRKELHDSIGLSGKGPRAWAWPTAARSQEKDYPRDGTPRSSKSTKAMTAATPLEVQHNNSVKLQHPQPRS